MKFSVYGRFQVEVCRENNAWAIYRLELGKRRKMDDIVIPATLEVGAIAMFLDDIFHELSGPGDSIKPLS